MGANLLNSNTSKTPSTTPSKEKYIVEIGDALHKKIDKIVRVLNRLDNKSHSKKSWVLEAIQEKLSAEHHQPDEIIGSKHLTLSFEDDVKAKLDEIVAFQKKFRKTYSRKKWILEAIYEKIEREEETTENLLNDLKTSIQNVQK
jgi:predicted transcriptional regulator